MKNSVKEIRKKTKMTQKEFALFFGIPLSTVQHWEQGVRYPPDYVVAMLENNIEESERKNNEKQLKKIIKRLEEEREYSYADFEKYVQECSPCLDAEYDDYFHRGLERAIKIIQEIEKE